MVFPGRDSERMGVSFVGVVLGVIGAVVEWETDGTGPVLRPALSLVQPPAQCHSPEQGQGNLLSDSQGKPWLLLGPRITLARARGSRCTALDYASLGERGRCVDEGGGGGGPDLRPPPHPLLDPPLASALTYPFLPFF